MVRVAAVIFSFWATSFFAAALLSCAVFAAPDSRTSPLLPVALFALSIFFWRAAMGLWRPGKSSPSRVRFAAAISGPLFGIVGWSTSTPAQVRELLTAVVFAWLLFSSAAWWLARRVAREVTMVTLSSRGHR